MPNDNTIILIGLVMLLGGVFLGVIGSKIVGAGLPLLPGERGQYIAIAMALVAIVALTIDNRDHVYIAPLDRALITVPPEPAQLVTINLADCGPRTDDLTDQIVMTIEAESDITPLITGCHRIAQRQYVIHAGAGQ